MWSESVDQFAAGEVQIDHHLLRRATDRRRGITLIARPGPETTARVAGLAAELCDLEPKQYFYRPDELHVTVVATGLGARIEKPVKVVDNTLQTAAVAAPVAPQRGEQEVNYKDYERPTIQRQSYASGAAATKINPQDDLDYLDIPAFLRRQAD